MTTQQGANARVQLFQRKRLNQVVIRAGIQAADAVINGIAGGEDQHRLAELLPSHARQEVQTVFIRQAEVENHQAVVVAGQREGGFVGG